MNLRQLDLNLLIALDALLTARNITEAGRRVHLTQSAMSGALARLREFFGDELLVQAGRRMIPTPLAESLASPVREILLKIHSTIHTKPAFDPASSARRFSLMMSDYVATVLMPAVLQQAEVAAPHVEFDVQSNDVANPFETLERADVDFLIMPHHFLSPDHPSEPLYTDGYACLVTADNPLVGETLTAEQYLQLGHVVPRYRTRAAFVDEWFLSKQGITRRAEIFAMSFNAVPQLLVGTRRIATVHRRLAEFYARYLPLRIIAVPYDIPPLTEAVQWHRTLDEDPGNRWLRGLLIEAARRVT
jgi:LysR family transcriptional regulator, nod-box dependent transcriptional activator